MFCSWKEKLLFNLLMGTNYFMSNLKVIASFCVLQIWMAMTFCPTGRLWRSAKLTAFRSGAQSAPWGQITARTLPTTTRRTQPRLVGMRTASPRPTGTARVRETHEHTSSGLTDVLDLLLTGRCSASKYCHETNDHV